MKKSVILIIAVAILIGATAIGGTVATLLDRAIVTNTFEVGDISIALTETTGSEYKLIPGAVLHKDPTLTVGAGSEASWLFVKVKEGNNLEGYISYTMADGWTELTNGVYYRQCPAISNNTPYQILKDDSITVKDDITEEKLAALRESGAYPNLSFTAYAVQRAGFDSAEEAWEQAKKL